ncbi:hypothetical protein NMSP_1617 [Candidatus Nitrosomarinus catalina]|jgi:hypothetical protein|uniref:Water stress and hypersensitive response domain-containing protein n=1 Tax=Candidatus Nitrosomarinus catalinensis TaxID=1898749 RepID=A0A2Z2HSN0_9ARCH|nr:hypothetical protein [Candidatus Nitrosomarinus catalina]ARS65216.1 hypothetical protein NMSP_1617 [Candidatus Nitrosomarinus catalina]
MNPKVFVFAAVLTIVGILGAIVLVGPDMQAPSQGNNNSVENAPTIELLQVELADLSVTKINERSATIEIAFEIFNPNPRAVIVQTMDYNLFETGFSSYEQLAGGTIGSRPEGMVEFGSNYYTLLGDNSIVLKKKMVIKNTASSSELWDSLQSEYENGESGSAKWWVYGTVYFNLSSMTSGQENTVPFEFFR